MKFCFRRELILPLFLKRGMSFYELSRKTGGVAPQTIWRAVSGRPIGAKNAYAIAEALGINPMDFIIDDRKEVKANDDR